MAERHLFADLQQSLRLRTLGERPDPEPVGGTPQEQRVPHRIRRGDQQQHSRLVCKRLQPALEALLDPPGQGLRAEQAEPAGQLRCGKASRQLQQRQRIAAGLRNDAIADPLIEHEPDHRSEERLRVPFAKSANLERRKPLERLVGFARGEHQRDGLGQQPPGDERERQRRGVIQPLRVIDNAQQRPLVGRLRQQTQYRQPDEELIGRSPAAQSEHDPQRLVLGFGEASEAIEQRRAQLVKARICELHLGLHAGGTDHVEIGSGVQEVLEQRRLPDAGFPSDHERASFARTDVGDDPV